MKKLTVGDLGDFWYADYKEPLTQLEGAVPGHPVGVVLKAEDGRLLCAFCGKTYENLGNHAAMKHGLKARDYKREVGLLQSSSLHGEKSRIREVAVAQRRVRDPDDRFQARMIGSGGIGGGPVASRTDGILANRTPERLNKTGRCYAQLVEIARSVLRENGRLTGRLMRQRGVSEEIITRTFGSFVELQKLVGLAGDKRTRWADGALIEAMRGLALSLGRTPSRSDARRYGLPVKQLTTRWDGYSGACVAAGLDPNLPSPGSPSPYGEDDHIAMLAAYATSGNAARAAKTLGMGETTIRRTLARYGFPFPFHYKGPGRKEWAADMARRLAGWGEQAKAA